MMKTIKKIEPLRNTSSGNLRHVITFTDGTVAYTVPDSNVGRKVGNSEFIGVPVKVTFDQYARVWDVEVQS